jgi:hypothetical protein
LSWDVLTDAKTYEIGVDRGVLYPIDDVGVVWNGLISVDVDKEEASRTPFTFDGVNIHLDLVSPGEFSGKIKAITYPDELDPSYWIS